MIEGMTVIEATKRKRELAALICDEINKFQDATGTYVIGIYLHRPQMSDEGKSFGNTQAVEVRVGLTRQP
jgi:hypothetical protein